jgi:hypothetical protein
MTVAKIHSVFFEKQKQALKYVNHSKHRFESSHHKVSGIAVIFPTLAKTIKWSHPGPNHPNLGDVIFVAFRECYN